MIFKDPRQLKDTIKNKEKELKLPANTLINYYMMDRFIERLYHSKYRENFVIKGGFLNSSLIGINMRSTMDIDTTVKGLAIDQNSIEKIIEEILSIELDDNINWHIEKIIKAYKAREDIDKFAHLASFDEIKENNYNLNIPRYVDTFEEEEPIDLGEVSKNIREIQKENQRLRDDIYKDMKDLVANTDEAARELETFLQILGDNND